MSLTVRTPQTLVASCELSTAQAAAGVVLTFRSNVSRSVQVPHNFKRRAESSILLLCAPR